MRQSSVQGVTESFLTALQHNVGFLVPHH